MIVESLPPDKSGVMLITPAHASACSGTGYVVFSVHVGLRPGPGRAKTDILYDSFRQGCIPRAGTMGIVRTN